MRPVNYPAYYDVTTADDVFAVPRPTVLVGLDVAMNPQVMKIE